MPKKRRATQTPPDATDPSASTKATVNTSVAADRPSSVATDRGTDNGEAQHTRWAASGKSGAGREISDSGAALSASQWPSLEKQIRRQARECPPATVFGEAIKRGGVYRWGLATAMDQPCETPLEWLSRLAAGVGVKPSRFAAVDPSGLAGDLNSGRLSPLEPVDVAEAVIWAAALPGLLDHLSEHRWWEVLGRLQELRETVLECDPADPRALLGGAELGLTLAWRLQALPSCRRLQSRSERALDRWLERSEESLSSALAQPSQSRLVLASLWRMRQLLAHTFTDQQVLANQPDTKRQAKQTKRRRKQIDELAIELGTWMAALTRPGGQQIFSMLDRSVVDDDRRSTGLLKQAARLDEDHLLPAMKAALGGKGTRGRLAWQVSLPESMLHDEDAQLACLLPEWDLRRARLAIDYSQTQTRLELASGKAALLGGPCETEVRQDGRVCAPAEPWSVTCEYTDDDTHYLELEQPLEGGLALQRQWMLLRDDLVCLMADAVVRRDPLQGGAESSSTAAPVIDYQLRLPLGPSIDVAGEADTTELFLADAQRQRALVMALAADEWRAARSSVTLRASDDHHLVLAARGRMQLYAPLWIDLSRHRFSKPRTWRRLTVGRDLQRLPEWSASAFRVQLGRAQWLLYRALPELEPTRPMPHTVFGKHLLADFYCARFDAEEQSYEELITVEDDPS